MVGCAHEVRLVLLHDSVVLEGWLLRDEGCVLFGLREMAWMLRQMRIHHVPSRHHWSHILLLMHLDHLAPLLVTPPDVPRGVQPFVQSRGGHRRGLGLGGRRRQVALTDNRGRRVVHFLHVLNVAEILLSASLLKQGHLDFLQHSAA